MPAVSPGLLIEGGRVLDPSRGLDAVADVFIQGGKVREIGPGLKTRLGQKRIQGSRLVSARGLWVLPGLIDMHVHLREPGSAQDETIRSGTRAAAKGGVTTVLAMPNTRPAIDTPARVRWVRERAERDARGRVLVCGAVSRGRRGAELVSMEGMAAVGAVAFSDDGVAVATAELMRRALERAKGLNLPVIEHCEEPGLQGGSRAAEAIVALRDIELARHTGGRVHLAHVSCRETVLALRRAKAEGLRVTGEACPHHFILTENDIPARDANFKMNPPLRTPADVSALREALADGTLEAIATDHAPHAPERKALPFERAPFGVIGLETLVPLSLELVRSGVLNPLRWAERVTWGPARLLGLKGLGSLAPGSEADVALIDPELERIAGPFESKSRNSPFAGAKLKGHAVATIFGGRFLLENGNLV